MDSPNIHLNEYLFVIYMWIEKNYQHNMKKNSEVSASSINRIKKKLLKLLTLLRAENKKSNQKIGDLIRPVQLDETIVVKGKFIRSPSAQRDAIKGETWLVGCVEERTGRFNLEIVPNMKAETMKL